MRSGLIGLGIVLLVIWVLGFIVFKVAGLFIHILVIVGVVMLISGLIRRVRGPTAP